jgi:nitrogen fixation protein
LIGNEAGFNGDPAGFHNAPEAFGHGGIVFVNGPSSHTFLDGNWCHHNQGGGIVLRGDEATAGAAWKAYHWVIQRNKLEANRWGIYARHADWITLGSNEFTYNREGDFFDAGNVTNVVKLAGQPTGAPPVLQFFDADTDVFLLGSGTAFSYASPESPASRPIRTRWEFGDGTTATEATLWHGFKEPDFYSVGITVDDGALADLGWRDVHVVDELEERFESISNWSVRDTSGTSRAQFELARVACLSKNGCVHARVEPYDGGRVELVHRGALVDLQWRKELVFWLRVRNENIPAWQDANPIVTLKQDDEHVARYVPERDLLSQPLHNEGRDGWNRFVVPLAGGNGWKRQGPELKKVTELALGFDSWGAPPLDIWIDVLAFR